MDISGCSVSCGVHQLYGLYPDTYGPVPWTRLERALAMLSTTYAARTSTIVFSDADEEGNGKILEGEIVGAFGRDGLVFTTAINPNSGRSITTWLWSPNWEEVAEWMGKQGTKKEPKFTKAATKRIAENYRAEPDSNECDCEDCRRDRGE